MEKKGIEEKRAIDTNVIYCGDCKDILKKLPEESIDLIYLDPPFFSQKHYGAIWDIGKKDNPIKTQFSDKEWNKLKKVIKPDILKMYEHIEERWKGGKGKGIHVYIAYMRERLEQCWRVLKSTGSIYLHCDWHAGHYLKQMMDDVFDYENFRNEIVWHYKKWSTGWKQFQRNHDTIFFYSKTNSKKRTFNISYMKRAQSTLKRFGEAKIISSFDIKSGERLPAKISEENSKGVLMDDVWEIGRVPPIKQRNPTEKPEALIDRIINASSNKGDIILDPFCAGGTTLISAQKNQRRFIGIDISRTACYLAKKELKGNVKVYGSETINEIQKINPHEVANLIIVERWNGIINPKKSGDMGIDGWVEFRTIPVQVKRWEHKVGRPEIDKFKTAIERDHKTKGIIIAKDFSKDCYAEVARIKNENKIDINLVKFEDIFESHNRSQYHYHGRPIINHPAFMIL